MTRPLFVTGDSVVFSLLVTRPFFVTGDSADSIVLYCIVSYSIVRPCVSVLTLCLGCGLDEMSVTGDSAVFSLLMARLFFVTGDSAVFSLLVTRLCFVTGDSAVFRYW